MLVVGVFYGLLGVCDLLVCLLSCHSGRNAFCKLAVCLNSDDRIVSVLEIGHPCVMVVPKL